MPKKTQYVVKFVDIESTLNGVYYSREVSWGGVERDKATRLAHKEARRIRDVLAGRLEIKSVVELA